MAWTLFHIAGNSYYLLSTIALKAIFHSRLCVYVYLLMILVFEFLFCWHHVLFVYIFIMWWCHVLSAFVLKWHVSDSTLSLFDFPPFCEHTWFLIVAIGLWVLSLVCLSVSARSCQFITCDFPAIVSLAILCLPVIWTFAWFLTWPGLDSVFWIPLPWTLFDYWIFDLWLPVDYETVFARWIIAWELYYSFSRLITHKNWNL